MQYRKFGKLDWKASVLGFGAMRLPLLDDDMAHVNVEESVRMIRYAIDHGANYVDTAYPYHMGNSEITVGKALKDGYRQKVKLATKLPGFIANSPEDFDRLFNEQLNRLQTEYVDFYLLHGLNHDLWHKLQKMDVLNWAECNIARGRIGHLGFSFHDDYEVFKEIINAYDKWTFCQIQYNYMDVKNQAGTRGLKYAANRGLAVIIMEPIRGGALSNYIPPSVSSLWERSEIKRSPAEWALLWVWNHPEVTLALSGMSNMQQVRENVASADKARVNQLGGDELRLINSVKYTYRKIARIPCTRCGYCMPCTNGVDIPRNFEIYSDAFMFNEPDRSRMAYDFPDHRSHKADLCTECGTCVGKSPQKIDIPSWLKKVHGYLSLKRGEQ